MEFLSLKRQQKHFQGVRFNNHCHLDQMIRYQPDADILRRVYKYMKIYDIKRAQKNIKIFYLKITFSQCTQL